MYSVASNRMSVFSSSGSGPITLLTAVQEPAGLGPDKVIAGETGWVVASFPWSSCLVLQYPEIKMVLNNPSILLEHEFSDFLKGYQVQFLKTEGWQRRDLSILPCVY